MRILITNNTLAIRAGSELYVRDLAIRLLQLGHSPVAYSPVLGEVADELRRATVPVIDDLNQLTEPPDIIHGHHHLPTMTALLHFAAVPAIHVCHGWWPWEETPPRFPRILKYVAVDEVCGDRLALESGIPAERVRLVLNFVDLDRFKPRAPLPARPQRALLFSNYATEKTHVPIVREACSHYGITLDVVGAGVDNATSKPEEFLGQYDLVFAKARSALEALAVGCAVVLCDFGVGPFVTTKQLDDLRRLNFGIRTLRSPFTVQALAEQIERYDAADAQRVSAQLRATAGRDQVVDELVSIYEQVLEESRTQTIDAVGEGRAVARYLRSLQTQLTRMENQIFLANSNVAELENRISELQGELAAVKGTFGWRLMSVYGPFKYRFVLPALQRLNKSSRQTSGEKSETPPKNNPVSSQASST